MTDPQSVVRASCLLAGTTWIVLAWAGHLAPSLGAAAVFFGLIGLGTFLPRWSVHAPCLCAVRTDAPLLALTFDDGPHPMHTRAVLDALDAHGAKATFFVIGEKAAREPELIKEIALRGHQVENHSWGHGWFFPVRSRKAMALDLGRTSDLVERHTGRGPRWLRPPYGIVSPPIARGMRGSGLALCGWSAAARDGVPWRSPHGALRRLVRGIAPGAILALHDAPQRGDRAPVSVKILDALLLEMAHRGLRSVTLDTLASPRAPNKEPSRP